jgi:hypothetical protein
MGSTKYLSKYTDVILAMYLTLTFASYIVYTVTHSELC